MSKQPEYLVNTMYGFTTEKEKKLKTDFIFLTYKEGLTKETKMRIVKDTTVEYFITKEGLQNQNVKKQTCSINEVDGYTCRQKDLAYEIGRRLKIPGYNPLAELSKSYYLYGADISAEFLLRMKYNKNSMEDAKKLNLPESLPYSLLKRGALDIETSVLGNYKLGNTQLIGDEINLISFVDDDFNVYCSIFKPFLQGKTEEDVINHVNKVFTGVTKEDNKIDKYGIKFNYFIHDSELECIKWIFKKIHEVGLDFISVWNMGFDIPGIMNRIAYHGEQVENIFCHPKIPKNYRVCKYKKGKTRDSEHFAEKWDWLSCTSISQFYDSMGLFARLKKVDGHENSYRLGYITDKYIGENKLFAEEESTFHVMETERFLDFIAYNIWDAVLLVILEKKMNHVHNLFGLSQDNPFSIFNKNTVKGKNLYYKYCRENDEVLCTVVGNAYDTDNDVDELPALGGAVLNPNLAINTGVDFLKDSKRLSKVHKKNKDIDAEGMYPSISQVINDSRDTVLYTLLAINNDPNKVEDFTTNYIDTKENSVYLMNEYFNLPNYEEMLKEYEKRKVA